MKNIKSVTMVCILIFCFQLHSYSQDTLKTESFIPYKNVIRYNLTPNILGFSSAIFGYERVVNPHQSFSINAGYLSIGKSGKKDNEDYKSQIDPVILATLIAFGFVFIHPFMDGNGRIHRYLIHEVLTKAGFTPRGIILPVSAVILANLHDYVSVLEDFSKPLQARTIYNPDTPDITATGNDSVYFRYFDATPQAEFLYQALIRTVEDDLEKEIKYLLGFEQAYTALNELLDWPSHRLELFIRVVRQNNGTLSKSKQKNYFDWMTNEEIQKAEQQVIEAFEHN